MLPEDNCPLAAARPLYTNYSEYKIISPPLGGVGASQRARTKFASLPPCLNHKIQVRL